MHLFAVFCLIFRVLAHCGHPGIQHISLQSLEKTSETRRGVTIECMQRQLHIAKLYQPPSSSAAATFKVVQKTRKRSGSVPHCPKTMVHFFVSHGLLSLLLLTPWPPPKKNCFVSRWWQLKYFWEFSPRNLGQMNPFWRARFSDGSVKNHQPGLVSTGKNQAIWSNASPWRAPPRNGAAAFGGRLLGPISAGLTLGTRQKV